jgi:DNA topoisomerase-3
MKFVPNFSGKEKEVYDFVVRHFLACCSKDAQGLKTIVDIDIAGEKVKFYVSVIVLLI